MSDPVPPAAPICLLVAGMHRSGTSMTARLLSILGCRLPRDLAAVDAANPMGYWEPARLIALHEALLVAARSDWNDFTRLDPARVPPDALAAYRAGLATMLAEEAGGAPDDPPPVLLWKEPRMCRLLGLTLPALRALGAGAQVVIPWRHPAEVAASLNRIRPYPAQAGVLLWLRHNLDAERDSRGVPRAVLGYDGTMADWAGQMRRVAAQLGQGWPVDDPAVAQRVAGFIRPGARHHAAPHPDWAAGLGRAGEMAAALLPALDALAEDPGDAAARTTCDALTSELEALDALVGPTLAYQFDYTHGLAARAAEARRRARRLARRAPPATR